MGTGDREERDMRDGYTGWPKKKDTETVKIRFGINSIKNTMKHTINRSIYVCLMMSQVIFNKFM